MQRTISIVALLLAALMLSGCGTLTTDLAPSAAVGNRPFGLPLQPARIGQAIDGPSCARQQTLVCTDNGGWARCHCAG